MGARKGIFSQRSNLEERFIGDTAKLEEYVGHLKALGQTIVLTKGVYDLVHIGHTTYLEKAAEHGDILIVAVDSDRLTRERKGPKRPIVPEDERLTMLVHLRAVDIVTLRDVFDDHLVETLQPDVLIVSESTSDVNKDWIRRWEEHCGEVVVLPPQATTSTTARIRQLTIDGAEELGQKIKLSLEEFLASIRGEEVTNSEVETEPERAV